MSIPDFSRLSSLSIGLTNTGNQTNKLPEQIKSNDSKRFLMLGLSILKKQHTPCVSFQVGPTSECYIHCGVGNFISDSTNKVYVLTVEHLFGYESEDYVLTHNNKFLVSFL